MDFNEKRWLKGRSSSKSVEEAEKILKNFTQKDESALSKLNILFSKNYEIKI